MAPPRPELEKRVGAELLTQLTDGNSDLKDTLAKLPVGSNDVRDTLAKLATRNRSELWTMLVQTLITPLTLAVFSFFLSGRLEKSQEGFLTQFQKQALEATDKAHRQRATEEEVRRKEAQARREEQRQDALRARRLWTWDQVAEDLYELQCYVLAVPECRLLSVESVLGRKQHCDSVIHANREFLPDSVLKSYADFAEAAFESAKKPAGSLRLRCSYANRPLVKKRAQKKLFAYGKDIKSALAQHKQISEKWKILRHEISQMIATPAPELPPR